MSGLRADIQSNLSWGINEDSNLNQGRKLSEKQSGKRGAGEEERWKIKPGKNQSHKKNRTDVDRWFQLLAAAYHPTYHYIDGPWRWTIGEAPHYFLQRSHSSTLISWEKGAPASPTFNVIFLLCRTGLDLAYQAPFLKHSSPFLWENCFCDDSQKRSHKALNYQCPLLPCSVASALCFPFQRQFRICFCAFGPIQQLPLLAKQKSTVTFPPPHCLPKTGCHW